MVGARRVFLSHTSELRDYPQDRSFVAAAEAAVARAGDAITDMAYFTAREGESAAYCQRRVRECDVYVGLIGLRYGTPVRDRQEVSYTELEFDTATEAKLPRLVFLLDQEAALPIPAVRLIDRDPELQARQRAFRDRLLGAGIMVAKVASPEELELNLLHALQQSRPESAPGGHRLGLPAPAAVAVPERMHNLPRPPARVFVGRASALGQLRGSLADDANAVVTQAVYGLGGVGKSELALHHAATCRAEYSLVWWIPAEDTAQIQAGLAALTTRLCRGTGAAVTTEEAAEWGTGWLQAHRGWLLILDNVNEPTDVELLLGELSGGHVLITTRRDTGWEQIADPIRLDVLDPGPAAELLATRTGYRDTTSQDAVAAIATELGYLPLALDQAAAYITQTRLTPAVYLQRLHEHPATMYAAAASGQAQRTVARVWDITIEAIRARQLPAINLLHILAYYAPDNVPRIILGGGDETVRLAVDDALGVLASYSMITLTPQTVSMHRLVQAVILARHPTAEESATFGGGPPEITALEWLDDAIRGNPETDVAEWPLLRVLIPHAGELSARIPPGDQPRRLARIQNHIGLFQGSQGQHEQALALLESALKITEAALGSDDPLIAVRLDNLALAYGDLGQNGKALPLQQRALRITEAALGPDHPDTATRLNNLATTYSALGQSGKALPLQQRTLQIIEVALGPDDRLTAISLDNLAYTYRALGQPDKALPLRQRALRITETAHGPDHPDTALRLNNLATTYSALGQSGKALPLQQRALRITEAALGPDHPDTATRLDNLAYTYGDLGQDDKALPLQQRALRITEAALGPDHPDTALRLDNLAYTYGALGQHDKALPLRQRAPRITEAALGPDHPDTATRLDNLAYTYGALGQHDKALPLRQRALRITEAALGPDHPDTALRLDNLAYTYGALSQHDKALPLRQRAQQIKAGRRR